MIHHLSQAEYGAWVLILQLGSYINLLDFGLQTVISKLIAENDALGDGEANHHLLSTSFNVLAGVACLGTCLVLIMVWRVPQLFHQMPYELLPKVRLGLLVIGTSAAFALPFNPFLSVFTGLQEYGFPTVLALSSRLISAATLIVLVLLHGGLLPLTFALALVNVVTAIAQFYGWKHYVSQRISFSFKRFHPSAARLLLKSGGVLAIWTIGGLFVNGFDLLIVGHFDYANTGFYAIAASATNFLLMILSSLFSPLLPAVSSMQAASTPVEIGNLTLRYSRYCTICLLAISLPLLVGAFPLLSLWVGRTYALKTVPFLEWLVLGNCVRQLAYPYSLVIIATGKQHLATLATVAEAVINLAVSVWLAHKIGAIGVAYGTLAGAFVSLGLHLLVSMRRTHSVIDFPVSRFLTHSLLRPLTCVLPLLFLVHSWNRLALLPAKSSLLAAWIVATTALLYFIALTPLDRKEILRHFQKINPSAREAD